MKKLILLALTLMSLNTAFAQNCTQSVITGSMCKIDFKVAMDELESSVADLKDTTDKVAAKEVICESINAVKAKAQVVRDLFLEEGKSCFDAVRVEDDVLYKAKFNTVLSRTVDLRGFCGGLLGSLTRVQENDLEGLKSGIRNYQKSLSFLKSYVANGGSSDGL